MPKTSIIIPVFNQFRLTHQCIDSIKKNTDDAEIIIVDNGSSPRWQGNGKIIRNEKNLGFPVAVNQGIKAAKGDVIVILNNDTIVTPNWLEHLHEHLKNYDIVGPMTNEISGPQKIEGLPSNLSAAINLFAFKKYQENKGRSFPFHRLVFFCVAIKKSVIDKIGYLDEQFSPGNFEDDDFCLRAIAADFKLGVAKDVFIYHLGSVTHKALNLDYQKLLKTNKAKFNKKWTKEKYLKLHKNAQEGGLPEILPKKHDITLCIIAKNEEIGLKKTIESARPYVQDVIVAVDDSSNDKTLEIAEKYADVVKRFRWSDDFSAARNFCHDGVWTKWILFLDGHETLEKWPDYFLLPKNDIDGLVVPIEMENGIIFHGLRIYKNGLQFKGATHELVQCKKASRAEGLLIKHNRLGAQAPEAAAARSKQRDDQIPRIMSEQLRRNPSNIHASFHLANHFQGKGQFGEAFKNQSLYLKYSKDKEGRWFVYFNRSLCHLSLGHFFRAFWAACMADLEVPGRWEISKLKGMIFYQKGWNDKALQNFIESFKVNYGKQLFRPWKRNEGGTWNIIGEIFYCKGMYDKASIAFDEASKRVELPHFQVILKKRSALMAEMMKKC